MSLIKHVNKRIPENIIIEIIGGHKVFGSYITPTDSPYGDETDFSNISNVFYPVNSNYVTIGGGDLNARVGDIAQRLPFDNCKYRVNIDNTINDYGRILRKLCKSSKCYVINNLDIGTKKLDGSFTFHKGERKSQNDLILTNEKGLMCIKNFIIHDIAANPSDHTPVSVELDVNAVDESIGVNASHDILSDQSTCNIRKPRRIKDNIIDWNSYSVITDHDYNSYEDSILNLEHNKSVTSVDEAVDCLSKSLYNAAQTLTPPTEETNEVDRGNVLLNRKDLQCSFEEWECVKRDVVTFLKDDVTKKERQTWNNLIKEKDSKALWGKISWKGTVGHVSESNKPTLDELSEHFQKKGESTAERSTLLSEVTGGAYVEELDREISMEEFQTAQRGLKENRATSDGWCKRMVTSLPLRAAYAVLLIFNTILLSHIFPTKWRTTTVNEIFKNKGETRYAAYYRPISLVQLLAKLFDVILTNRFTKWFKPHDCQTAYQPGKSSADHVFLLRCLVAQAKRHKQTLYIIAADFDGAFDRISRAVLIRKLIRFGAGTVFVMCLASMYMSTDNVIFRGGEHVMYTLFSGIKQGLPLSPYLFIFYINDIFDLFENTYGKLSDNIYKLIKILIHADDVTLLAVSRADAIEKLKTLCNYCTQNYIVPQFTKCEFVAINGEENVDTVSLPFGSSFLDHVNHLTILGSHVSSSGRLTDDLELHMKKRYSSCMKFYNFCRQNKLAPLSIKIKVLKACVVNSLLHNCETWGKPVPDGLETLYNKLIRCALNVRSNTPTLLMYIEAGLLPIKAVIEARQYKFFKRFPSTIEALSSRDHLFKALIDDPSSYLKHYILLEQRYESHQDIYKFHNDQMKIKIRNNVRNEKYRYKIYSQLNPTLEQSPFMNCLHPLTKNVVKFRLGSHKLPIETGRWNRTKREQRHCVLCNTLGDERHFMFACPSIKRDDLNLVNDISQIWSQEDVFELFKRFKDADLL